MANIKFDNIIDPIKRLRMATAGGKFSVELIEGRQVIVPEAAMGLKEAKDFVEACMALGVRRYLADQLALANREAGRTYADPQDGDIRF